MSVNVSYIAVMDNNVAGSVIENLTSVLNVANDVNNTEFVSRQKTNEDTGKTVVEFNSNYRFTHIDDSTVYTDYYRLNYVIPEFERILESTKNFGDSVEIFYLDENSAFFAVNFDEIFEFFDDKGEWAFLDHMNERYPVVNEQLVNNAKKVLDNATTENEDDDFESYTVSEPVRTVVEEFVNVNVESFNNTVISEVFYVFEGRGIQPGSFTESLIIAIAKADAINRAKLATVYPDYVKVVSAYQNSENGYNKMVEKVFGNS